MKLVLKFLFLGGVVCGSLATIAGCSSSKLVDVWSDPASNAPPVHWLLVISVDKNSGQRRICEDAFSAELAKQNVSPTSSYKLFPEGRPDSMEVMRTAKANGFDGVLVMAWVEEGSRSRCLRVYADKEPGKGEDRGSDEFSTYYRRIFRSTSAAALADEIPAIDVWTTRNDGQMIWSAQSALRGGGPVGTIQPEIVGLVINELTEHGIISSRR